MAKKHEDIKELDLLVEKIKEDFKGCHIVNEDNMAKFVRVCNLMNEIAEEADGEIIDMGYCPDGLRGNVSMDVDVFDIHNGGLKAFEEVLSLVDVFTVVPSDHDSLLIDVSVNKVLEIVPAK